MKREHPPQPSPPPADTDPGTVYPSPGWIRREVREQNFLRVGATIAWAFACVNCIIGAVRALIVRDWSGVVVSSVGLAVIVGVWTLTLWYRRHLDGQYQAIQEQSKLLAEMSAASRSRAVATIFGDDDLDTQARH